MKPKTIDEAKAELKLFLIADLFTRSEAERFIQLVDQLLEARVNAFIESLSDQTVRRAAKARLEKWWKELESLRGPKDRSTAEGRRQHNRRSQLYRNIKLARKELVDVSRA